MKIIQCDPLPNTSPVILTFPNPITPLSLHARDKSVYLSYEADLTGQSTRYQFRWVEVCEDVPAAVPYIGSVVRPGKVLPSHLYGKKMEEWQK